MLNRRLLRIKAMQAIYAYYQAQNSDYELAQDLIRQEFEPDLNAMEKQDRSQLKRDASLAITIFEQSYSSKEVVTHPKATPKINHSVAKAIDFYYKSLQKDYDFYYREMIGEVDELYENYLYILLFGVELAKLVESQREKRSANPNNIKINSEYKLANNRIISIISQNQDFQENIIRKNISWENEKDMMIQFLQDLKKDKTYQNYIALGESNLEQDWQIVDFIFREYLFKKSQEDNPNEQEDLQAFFEKKDLNWTENREILKSMVLKTLKKAKESPQSFELAELSQDWETDKAFFEQLYHNTLREAANYEELLSEKAQNWKTERFVLIDKILIQMAIAEMIHCESIPVKVTINEYIELAKNYSTPKSKNFINGILNAISEELKANGIIKKSGRGLLDNK
jgi:N utilization substance protein B